jgi:hypothetical protein
MTWFSFLTAIIYLVFIIPISLNMIKIIQLIRQKTFNDEEETQNSFKIRKRRNKVIFLTIFLVITMFLTFFINYLIEH